MMRIIAAIVLVASLSGHVMADGLTIETALNGSGMISGYPMPGTNLLNWNNQNVNGFLTLNGMLMVDPAPNVQNSYTGTFDPAPGSLTLNVGVLTLSDVSVSLGNGLLSLPYATFTPSGNPNVLYVNFTAPVPEPPIWIMLAVVLPALNALGRRMLFRA